MEPPHREGKRLRRSDTQSKSSRRRHNRWADNDTNHRVHSGGDHSRSTHHIGPDPPCNVGAGDFIWVLANLYQNRKRDLADADGKCGRWLARVKDVTLGKTMDQGTFYVQWFLRISEVEDTESYHLLNEDRETLCTDVHDEVPAAHVISKASVSFISPEKDQRFRIEAAECGSYSSCSSDEDLLKEPFVFDSETAIELWTSINRDRNYYFSRRYDHTDKRTTGQPPKNILDDEIAVTMLLKKHPSVLKDWRRQQRSKDQTRHREEKGSTNGPISSSSTGGASGTTINTAITASSTVPCTTTTTTTTTTTASKASTCSNSSRSSRHTHPHAAITISPASASRRYGRGTVHNTTNITTDTKSPKSITTNTSSNKQRPPTRKESPSSKTSSRRSHLHPHAVQPPPPAPPPQPKAEEEAQQSSSSPLPPSPSWRSATPPSPFLRPGERQREESVACSHSSVGSEEDDYSRSSQSSRSRSYWSEEEESQSQYSSARSSLSPFPATQTRRRSVSPARGDQVYDEEEDEGDDYDDDEEDDDMCSYEEQSECSEFADSQEEDARCSARSGNSSDGYRSNSSCSPNRPRSHSNSSCSSSLGTPEYYRSPVEGEDLEPPNKIQKASSYSNPESPLTPGSLASSVHSQGPPTTRKKEKEVSRGATGGGGGGGGVKAPNAPPVPAWPPCLSTPPQVVTTTQETTISTSEFQDMQNGVEAGTEVIVKRKKMDGVNHNTSTTLSSSTDNTQSTVIRHDGSGRLIKATSRHITGRMHFMRELEVVPATQHPNNTTSSTECSMESPHETDNGTQQTPSCNITKPNEQIKKGKQRQNKLKLKPGANNIDHNTPKARATAETRKKMKKSRQQSTASLLRKEGGKLSGSSSSNSSVSSSSVDSSSSDNEVRTTVTRQQLQQLQQQQLDADYLKMNSSPKMAGAPLTPPHEPQPPPSLEEQGGGRTPQQRGVIVGTASSPTSTIAQQSPQDVTKQKPGAKPRGRKRKHTTPPTATSDAAEEEEVSRNRSSRRRSTRHPHITPTTVKQPQPHPTPAAPPPKRKGGRPPKNDPNKNQLQQQQAALRPGKPNVADYRDPTPQSPPEQGQDNQQHQDVKADIMKREVFFNPPQKVRGRGGRPRKADKPPGHTTRGRRGRGGGVPTASPSTAVVATDILPKKSMGKYKKGRKYKQPARTMQVIQTEDRMRQHDHEDGKLFVEAPLPRTILWQQPLLLPNTRISAEFVDEVTGNVTFYPGVIKAIIAEHKYIVEYEGEEADGGQEFDVTDGQIEILDSRRTLQSRIDIIPRWSEVPVDMKAIKAIEKQTTYEVIDLDALVNKYDPEQVLAPSKPCVRMTTENITKHHGELEQRERELISAATQALADTQSGNTGKALPATGLPPLGIVGDTPHTVVQQTPVMCNA